MFGLSMAKKFSKTVMELAKIQQSEQKKNTEGKAAKNADKGH